MGHETQSNTRMKLPEGFRLVIWQKNRGKIWKFDRKLVEEIPTGDQVIFFQRGFLGEWAKFYLGASLAFFQRGFLGESRVTEDMKKPARTSCFPHKCFPPRIYMNIKFSTECIISVSPRLSFCKFRQRGHNFFPPRQAPPRHLDRVLLPSAHPITGEKMTKSP